MDKIKSIEKQIAQLVKQKQQLLETAEKSRIQQYLNKYIVIEESWLGNGTYYIKPESIRCKSLIGKGIRIYDNKGWILIGSISLAMVMKNDVTILSESEYFQSINNLLTNQLDQIL